MEKLNFNGIKKFVKATVPIVALGISPINSIKAQTEDSNLKNTQEKEIKAEKIEPIFTNDRNDPRLIEYMDRLALYNQSKVANDYLNKLGFVEKNEIIKLSKRLSLMYIVAPDFSDLPNYEYSESTPYGKRATLRVVQGKKNQVYHVGYSPKIKPSSTRLFFNPVALGKIDKVDSIYKNIYKKYIDDVENISYNEKYKIMENSPEYKEYLAELKKTANELGLKEDDCFACRIENIVPQYEMPKQEVVYVPSGFTTEVPGYSTIKIRYDRSGKPLFYENEAGEKISYNTNAPSFKPTKEFTYPNYYKQMKNQRQKKP